MRKIIHIDMDAFYASVEQRDQPRYSGSQASSVQAAMRWQEFQDCKCTAPD